MHGSNISWPRLRAVFAGLVLAAFCLCGCEVVPQEEKQAPTADPTLTAQDLLSPAAVAQAHIPGSILAKSYGPSMEPTYSDGTLFLIVPTKWSDLKPGDVVGYRSSTGIIIVHRIVHSYGDSWLIQGDNNPVPDQEVVTPQNLVGEVETSFLPPSPGNN